jgi:hypothetical protein
VSRVSPGHGRKLRSISHSGPIDCRDEGGAQRLSSGHPVGHIIPHTTQCKLPGTSKLYQGLGVGAEPRGEKYHHHKTVCTNILRNGAREPAGTFRFMILCAVFWEINHIDRDCQIQDALI